MALVLASAVPSEVLASRLLGAAGEADRSGVRTQDLLAHFGERLRFSGLSFLVIAELLWLTRFALAEMFAAAIADVRAGVLRMQISMVDALVLGAISVGALALRLVFVNQPIRYDEALTFNEFASRPLYYGLSYYPDPNNHLLNTLLMHVAFVALGNQPWVLRLPALLAGVALVPATYALARVLYARFWVAPLAGALVGVSSYIVEYSTNARGYTLQALCFVALLTLAEMFVQRRSLSALLAAAVVGALGVYAVPTMVYGIAVAAAWLVVRGQRGLAALLTAGAVCVLLALLLYLPVVLISGPDALVGNRFVVPLGADELASELPRSLASTWTLWNRDIPWPIGLMLLGAFAWQIAREIRNRRVPLGLLAPAVCLVLVVAQRVAPFERVWLFLLPLYFSVAAAGLARIAYFVAPIAAAAMAFAVVTSGSILASTETGAFPDAAAVARALQGQLQPEDAVVTQLPASLPELQYEFARAGLPTAPLVHNLSQATTRVFVIAPRSGEASVGEWRPARTLAEFSTARLLELDRDD